MPKNIIICSDGTGNTAVKGRGTNVFKLYEAVDVVGHEADPSLREQVSIYDDGVGTQKLKLLRVLAGAFGWGLARNVCQLYEELVRVYEHGDGQNPDQIYLFGFSRGAFTVRTLSGFIDKAGIIDGTGLTADQVSKAVRAEYRSYRKTNPALLEKWVFSPIGELLRLPGRLLAKVFKSWAAPEPAKRPCRIRFLGVWDTVDAVGFPVPFLAEFWNVLIYRFKFKESKLRGCVDHACHAMAIDEERKSFELYLFEHEEGRTEQVWFPGVHSNVGGGYPKQGISLVALDWMMAHAEEASRESGGRPTLRFQQTLRKQYREAQNPHDYLYDSRSGLAIYYRYGPRPIGELCKGAGVPVKVHVSAIRRIKKRTRGYAPGNLPETFEVVGTPGVEPAGELGDTKLPARVENGGRETGFSGAKGRLAFWRKGIQWVFYGVQALLLIAAIRSPAVTDDLQAEIDSQQQPIVASLASWKVDFAPIIQWGRGVAESAVAPVPGEFAQQQIVRPMFRQHRLGLIFLIVFPLSYFLGLWGRVQQCKINSEHWRAVESSLPGSKKPTNAENGRAEAEG